MAIEVTDYVLIGPRLEALGLNPTPDVLTLLPENLDSAQTGEQLRQHSDAATVRTLFRTSGIVLGEVIPPSMQIPYIQNNALEWFGPTLFVSSAILSSHPDAISVALNVLSNYLTDFFKGVSGEKRVKLQIVYERAKGQSTKHISYEGSAEGIRDIAKVIRELNDAEVDN